MLGALQLAKNQEWTLTLIVFGPLLLAAGIVVIRGSAVVRGSDHIKLSSELGHAGWDFTTSFATNATVIGSVLGTILAAQVLPQTTKVLPSATFGSLSVVFGVLVIVAPLLYNGTMKRVEVKPPNQDTAFEYHGTVWGFLAATAVTLWGLFGSVATAFAALLELEFAGSLTMPVLIAIAIVLAVVLGFFIRYMWTIIEGTIRDQLDAPVHDARRTLVSASRMANNLGAVAPAEKIPLPVWHLA